jgi:signal transduction histidine kinase/HAMP domain-containing protein
VRLGVGGRLLLAFLGISGLAVVGGGIAIFSFREIGEVLERITAHRVPAALTLQELSRHAERIVSAAPALLAAETPTDHAERSAKIRAEVQALASLFEALESRGTERAALASVRSAVSRLRENLESLDKLVADRIVLRDRKRNHVRSLLDSQLEAQRLLTPWLQIVDDEITQSRVMVGGTSTGADVRAAAGARLAIATASYGSLQRLQLLLTSVSDRLQQVATTDDVGELHVHVFRTKQALDESAKLVAGLDARLRPLLASKLEELRSHVEGSENVPELREHELGMLTQATQHLSENAALSGQLANAVNALVANVRHDIAQATEDATSVQKVSSTILTSAVALSVISSILIVWLYVGRNIVRRLTALSTGMLAIAGGKLDARIAAQQGPDEIGAMARAVEVFRQNAIELKGLLADREQAAVRLEQIVEERTRELERRSSVLRVTFDNMGHGVVMFDRDHRMVAWNERFKELLELSDQDVGPDVSFQTFIRRLAERGEFGPSHVEELVKERLSSLDRPFQGERRRPNGTVLEIRRNPIRAGGFVSIYTDVTEQRQAQAEVEKAKARLTDAIESISDGFALWDDDDRLLIFNSHCAEFLEAADLFVVGAHFEDILRAYTGRGQYDASSAGSAASWINQRLALHRNPPSACEMRLASGRWLHVREFQTQEGGTVTVWADVTAAKEREQELETARDAAAEASQTMEEAYRKLKAAQANLVHAEKMASLGQLTAGIAHEIKNPLNFVNNFAALSDELLMELKEGLRPAMNALSREAVTEVEELIATLSGNVLKIAEHGRRADGIVRSMLLHSRGGSGDRQKVNLNSLIDDALNLAYHGARAQDQNFNVTLERDFDSNAVLELVPQDITRVFLNLFSNGFYSIGKRLPEGQAGPEYRPTLRVTTRDFGNEVEARVWDNGIGIAPEARAKLFTPFFTTKPTGEGTGLGLSISYDIVVQQHGGAITVDSCRGEFTEFVVRLPRAAEQRHQPSGELGHDGEHFGRR